MTTVHKYRPKRRIVQLVTLILIALIPATGLFRIDLASASFFFLNHQVWWSNFTLLTGFALVFATAPILTYMTIGTAWCGWACPQNLLSEWANNLTYKLLGKRASVEVTGEGLKIAAAKNKLLNWIILGASFLAVSLVLSLILFLFFYTPTEVWEIVTLASAEKLSPFILYLFVVFLIFIDIAVVRYFLCDYACFYRMGQRIFKTHDALHISYDATRSSDCTKCNYCATVCITNIQPTAIEPHDICINCGECIDACDRLHQKINTVGLLNFKLSSESASSTWYRKVLNALWRANRLVVMLFMAGIVMVVWGVLTQPKELPKIPFAVQQKTRSIERICNAQCEPQTISCKSRNMEGCYRAAACKCECALQHEPTDAEGIKLRACVVKNQEHAEAEAARMLHPGARKPVIVQ